MLKTTLYILGVILAAVGIIGYFNNPVFGIFLTDNTQSTIHLIAGLTALYFGTQVVEQEHVYGRVMAVIYGIMTIVSLAASASVLGLAMNAADTVLYLVLTIAFLYTGFAESTEGNYSSHVKA